MILIYLNITTFKFIIDYVAFKDRLTYRLELFNEFCNHIITVSIILYTDFVPYDDTKYQFGWFMYLMMLFNFSIGFMVPIIYSVLATYRRYKLKREKKKKYLKAISKNLRESVKK